MRNTILRATGPSQRALRVQRPRRSGGFPAALAPRRTSRDVARKHARRNSHVAVAPGTSHIDCCNRVTKRRGMWLLIGRSVMLFGGLFSDTCCFEMGPGMGGRGEGLALPKGMLFSAILLFATALSAESRPTSIGGHLGNNLYDPEGLARGDDTAGLLPSRSTVLALYYSDGVHLLWACGIGAPLPVGPGASQGWGRDAVRTTASSLTMYGNSSIVWIGSAPPSICFSRGVPAAETAAAADLLRRCGPR